MATTANPVATQASIGSQNVARPSTAPSGSSSTIIAPKETFDDTRASSSTASSDVGILTGQMKKFTISLGTKAQRLARAQAARTVSVGNDETIRAKQVPERSTAFGYGAMKPAPLETIPATPVSIEQGSIPTPQESEAISPVLDSTVIKPSPMTPSNSMSRDREIPETPAFVDSPITPKVPVPSVPDIESVASVNSPKESTISTTVKIEEEVESSSAQHERVLPKFTSTGIIPFATRES